MSALKARTVAASLAATAVLVLTACASRAPAPVAERGDVSRKSAPQPTAGGSAPTEPSAKEGKDYYVVKRGDTLYGIALDHGVAYRDLAGWNNIENPNVIRAGQALRITPPRPTETAEAIAIAKAVESTSPVEAKPIDAKPLAGTALSADAPKREPKGGKMPYSEQALAQLQKGASTLQTSVAARPNTVIPKPETKPEQKVEPKPDAKPEASTAVEPEEGDEVVEWMWPAAGKILNGFKEPANKGIDIVGNPGDPVVAAAAGKVIYVGADIRGYGNLVVVKHNNLYLSAYAHNRKILVKDKQKVDKGQKIAELGNSDADQPKLHFEIRRQGKPMDPTKFLPARPQ